MDLGSTSQDAAVGETQHMYSKAERIDGVHELLAFMREHRQIVLKKEIDANDVVETVDHVLGWLRMPLMRSLSHIKHRSWRLSSGID